MLSPAQVVPFLTHADPLVRLHAVQYFRNCHDAAPLTGTAVWAAIDHLGGPPAADARSIVSRLSELPQDGASVGRLIAALADETDRDVVYHLRSAVLALPLALLEAHWEAVLACPDLEEETVAELKMRLDVVGLSADAVWDRLMDVGVRAAEAEDEEAGLLLDAEADALIEVAGRHVGVLAGRAMALLDDPAALTDYREVYAVRVIGEGRFTAAVGPLVERFLVDDDVLCEAVSTALVRIGTDDVADRLAAFIPGKAWDVRLFAADPLPKVKRPAFEAAVLRLLAVEPDDELKTNLLVDLCELGSLTGLDVARRHVVADPNHPETLGLCESLIATAVMHGVDLPEAPRWRERLAARDAKVAQRTKRFDAGDLTAFVDDLREQYPGLADEFDDGFDDGPPPPLPGEYDPYARIEPIRNDVAKVGRNDPCPCGSGKKHKKCCGAPK